MYGFPGHPGAGVPRRRHLPMFTAPEAAVYLEKTHKTIEEGS